MGKKANNEKSDRDEAVRLKTLAEKKFNSGDLTSALKYAARAHRLCPAVDGVAEMAAAFRILRAAAADSPDSDPKWYEILDLEPFSHINSIKSQYKKLALVLHPDKSSLEASGDAVKLLNDAFQVLSDRVTRREYDMKLRVSLQLQAEAAAAEAEADEAADTFWTSCSRCRLLHKFDRKYVGQSLVCPSCRKSFKAVEASPEVPRVCSEIGGGKKPNSAPKRKMSSIQEVLQRSDQTNKQKSMGDSLNDDMTLSELRLKLRKKPKVRKLKPLILRSDDMEVMKVEDSDFYDFDTDRAERSFKQGQVWAIYDDDDGMPRHHGLIDEVVSVNPFEVKMSWFDLQTNNNQSLMNWEKLGFHVSCGTFKVSRKDTINLVNVFSHMVKCERVARELYRIFPHKGSVWSLYNVEELEIEGVNSSIKEKRRYEIVSCLTSYSEMHGISMTRLEKVDGFRAVFRRKETGPSAVWWVEQCDFRRFSHQIPARKLCDDDVPEHLKDCWELDPAALPLDLLSS